ncbi:MAG: hypothetical protein JO131_09080, partial [Gammaproteobacteria bacterium]|nr:hypothetical protein [Gammaproteobacteria bacterium]
MTKEKSTFLLKPISQALFIMLFAPTVFAASNFQIVPNGTLPTQVSAGGSVAANYTVTNMTSSTLTGYSVEGLPNTVTQNAGTGNCPSTINLNAKASCNLELDVTGETHSTFAVCKGSNCTQPSAPLNVSVVNASTQKFIYVTDNQGPPNTISLCQLGNNGEITTCQDAGAESVLSGIHPQGIVLNTDETRAYITSALSLTVYQCSINPTNHTFSLCVGTPITTPSRTVSGLGMITLNPNNTFVYLPAN